MRQNHDNQKTWDDMNNADPIHKTHQIKTGQNKHKSK